MVASGDFVTTSKNLDLFPPVRSCLMIQKQMAFAENLIRVGGFACSPQLLNE